MAGRPPKPTALRILQGNAGKRPLPKNEPTSRRPAECPSTCQGRAREMWKKWAPIYAEMGCLREADTLAFAAWMQIEADMATLREAGQPVGVTIRKQALNYAVQFGATPSARVRVHVEPRKPESKLEKYRGGA